MADSFKLKNERRAGPCPAATGNALPDSVAGLDPELQA
jgi:hypothetical protein